MINALQFQLVARVMKLSKGRDEDWASYRVRCFRAARYAIARYLPCTTAWLTRFWLYVGHRAGAVVVVSAGEYSAHRASNVGVVGR